MDLHSIIFDVFDKYKNIKDVEIEFRLGWKGLSTTFSSDIGNFFFDNIKFQLNSCQHWDNVFSHKCHDVHFNNVRKSVFNDHVTYVKKESLFVHDYPLLNSPYDLRISVCKEIPLSVDFHHHDNNITFSRLKNRSSYIYKMWSYDLSHNIVDDIFLDNTCYHNNHFNFEIEYIHDHSQCYDNEYLTVSIISKIFDIVNIPL